MSTPESLFLLKVEAGGRPFYVPAANFDDAVQRFQKDIDRKNPDQPSGFGASFQPHDVRCVAGPGEFLLSDTALADAAETAAEKVSGSLIALCTVVTLFVVLLCTSMAWVAWNVDVTPAPCEREHIHSEQPLEAEAAAVFSTLAGFEGPPR